MGGRQVRNKVRHRQGMQILSSVWRWVLCCASGMVKIGAGWLAGEGGHDEALELR